jgi:hypothetical protein
MKELIAGRILKDMKDEEGKDVKRTAAEIMDDVILEGMLGKLEISHGQYGPSARWGAPFRRRRALPARPTCAALAIQRWSRESVAPLTPSGSSRSEPATPYPLGTPSRTSGLRGRNPLPSRRGCATCALGGN